MGWGPEDIAEALYELTANHLTGLREVAALKGLLPIIEAWEG